MEKKVPSFKDFHNCFMLYYKNKNTILETSQAFYLCAFVL